MLVPQTEILITKDGVELLRRTLPPGDYVLGRSRDCELAFEAELVSRRHAQLDIQYDQIFIEDLGSSNGTFVNGQPVTEATRLWPNQKIQIGSVTVECHRLKTVPPPDVSLAPAQAAIQRLLPEEVLRDRKYDIGGVVAQGGMGAILNARDSTTERTVAMKVTLDRSSPDDITRFVAEAKITAQLEHPNIVPVHELSVDEHGQPFYTMKMVRGITLKKVLELLTAGTEATVKKYSLPALLTIFQKACDAVAFAHSKGIIHRDLKPENIMLGDFGEVLVMDWGLAKRIRHESGATNGTTASTIERSLVRTPQCEFQTLCGTVMGTPHYMSPEQARGEVEDLDMRSDVYALGAILYHLLALQLPVQGVTAMEIVDRVAQGQVEPLVDPRAGAHSHLPGGRIPESLSAVVRKAMAFDRNQRYADLEKLQADLTAYQNGFATSAENAGLRKQAALLISRHKGVFKTAATAWLVITALAIWFILHLRSSEHKAVHNAQVAMENERRAVAQEEISRRALAKTNIALADTAYANADPHGMHTALDSVPEDLRNSEWRYLLQKSDTSIGNLDSIEVHGIAAHPIAPGVFAIADKAGKIGVIDIRTRKVIREFSADFGPSHVGGDWYVLAFSRLGDRLAIGHNGRGGIVIYDTQTGGKQAEWDAEPSRRLEWSDDGKLLLQRAEGGEDARHLNMLDASTGKVLWTVGRTTTGQQPADAGILLPYSKRVLIAREGRSSLPILDATSGDLLSEIKNDPPFSWITCFAVDQRANMVVVGNTVGDVMAVDLNTGTTKYRFRTGNSYIKLLSITPDGKRFISASEVIDGRNPLQIWDLASGKLLESLFGSSGGIAAVSAHPISGELVVTSNNRQQTRIWATTTVPETWSLPRNGSVCPPTFWNSDDRIFCGREERAVVLYDLSAKRTLWSSPTGQYDQVRVSADGTLAEVMPYSDRAKVLPNILLRSKPDGSPEPAGEFTYDGDKRLEQVSPDGHWLLMGRDRSFAIFDTLTRARQGTLGGPNLTVFRQHAWVPGANRVLSLATANGSRGTASSIEEILLQEVPSGKRLKAVNHPTVMNTLAVSKDGHVFAEAGVDRHIRIRDSETLEIKNEFRAHDAPIRSLAFHPSGRLIASSSDDFTIKIWEVTSGRLVEELRGLIFPPVNLTFSPSGRRLACATWGQSGLLSGTHVWELPSLAAVSDAPR